MQFGNFVRYSLNVIVMMSFISTGFAQKTQVYTQPEEIYYHAVELYDKELFGPAIEEFELFASKRNTEELLKEKASKKEKSHPATSNAEKYASELSLTPGHAEVTARP